MASVSVARLFVSGSKRSLRWHFVRLPNQMCFTFGPDSLFGYFGAFQVREQVLVWGEGCWGHVRCDRGTICWYFYLVLQIQHRKQIQKTIWGWDEQACLVLVWGEGDLCWLGTCLRRSLRRSLRRRWPLLGTCWMWPTEGWQLKSFRWRGNTTGLLDAADNNAADKRLISHLTETNQKYT